MTAAATVTAIIRAHGTHPGRAAPARRLGVGVVIAERYRLDRIIAHGGMSAVYLASDLKNQSMPLVLKIVDESLHHSKFIKESLALEKMVLKRLSERPSPLFPKFYDSDVNHASDRLYIAMEYIPGQTLKALLKGKEKLPLHKIIEITMHLCGLAALHRTGFFHRDLKPDNIIINENRTVVLDFGLACQNGHLDEPGMVAGTINYLSPEQALNQQLDTRTDIYTLGIILYEMISGRNPMVGENALETMSNHNLKPMPSLPVEDIEDRIRPEARKSFEKQTEELHRIFSGTLAKMTSKNRQERI